MDVIKKGFGSCLKNIRQIKNLTQEKLSEQIGINLRQLARIEAGESFITSETLYNICYSLDVSPRELFNFDIQTECLKDGTNNNVVSFNVIRSGNLIQLVNKVETCEEDYSNSSLSKSDDFDDKMQAMAQRIGKNINVDEIQDGVVMCTKVFKPNGEMDIIYQNTNADFEELKNKVVSIAHDKKKLDFMNLAFEALSSASALSDLKFLIRGIELTQE